VFSNLAISISSPNVLNRVNLSALFYFPSWDFSLADFFFFKVVDSLVLNDLSFRNRTS